MFNLRILNLARATSAYRAADSILGKHVNSSIAKTTLLVGRQSRINTPVDTGRLRASTREQIFIGKGIVSTNTEYDVYVHEGTSRMQARPYMRRAVEDVLGEAETIFKKGVEDSLSDIGRRS